MLWRQAAAGLQIGCCRSSQDSSQTIPSYYQRMGLLEALANAFVRTFGITQPSEAMRRRAAWFILGMLALVLAALCGVGALLFHLARA